MNMYESPIEMIVNEMYTQMIQQEEDQLMMQVQKSLGFDIDKNELLRALNYGRDQYEKGYKDGRHDARWIPVSERLPEAGEYIGDVARYYLVQNEYGDMLIARYTHGEYWEQIYQLKPIGDEIVAWMPLPAPYELQEESEG